MVETLKDHVIRKQRNHSKFCEFFRNWCYWHKFINMLRKSPYFHCENPKKFSQTFNRSKIGSMLLEPRSLFVSRNDMYKKFLQGIEEVREDTVDDQIFNLNRCNPKVVKLGRKLTRGTRISLTIRNIPRVSKMSVAQMIGRWCLWCVSNSMLICLFKSIGRFVWFFIQCNAM